MSAGALLASPRASWLAASPRLRGATAAALALLALAMVAAPGGAL